MAPGSAGANLHYNKARERKLERQMDYTEQREHGDNSFRLGDFGDVLDMPTKDLGTELSQMTVETFSLAHARTVEPEASTRAHPLVSARLVLPAPAPAPKSQRGN